MRSEKDFIVWNPDSPEIGYALENIVACVRNLKYCCGTRSDVGEKTNLLIDARVRLLKIHKKKMTISEYQKRAERTIDNLIQQKTDPATFAKKPEKRIVWSS